MGCARVGVWCRFFIVRFSSVEMEGDSGAADPGEHDRPGGTPVHKMFDNSIGGGEQVPSYIRRAIVKAENRRKTHRVRPISFTFQLFLVIQSLRDRP